MALERGLIGTLVFFADFFGVLGFLYFLTEDDLLDFLAVEGGCFFTVDFAFFGVGCFLGVTCFFTTSGVIRPNGSLL